MWEEKGSGIAKQSITERAILRVSIYLVSNYIIESQRKSQHNSTQKQIHRRMEFTRGLEAIAQSCSHLIFSKGGKIYIGKKASSNKWCRKAAVVICVFSRTPITILKRSFCSSTFCISHLFIELRFGLTSNNKLATLLCNF